MTAFCGRSAKQFLQASRNLCWKPQHVIAVEKTHAALNTAFYKRNYVKKTDTGDDENDKPVQFSTSEAAKWKAEYSRMGCKDDDSPESQPFIVSLSLAAFLIYFLYLREENDIDIKLGGGCSDTQTYLEFIQLNLIVEQNANNGVETDETILTRLKEIKKSNALLVNTV